MSLDGLRRVDITDQPALLQEQEEVLQQIRLGGVALVNDLFMSIKTVTVHSIDNVATDYPIRRLVGTLSELIDVVGAAQLIVADGEAYINDVRVRVEAKHFDNLVGEGGQCAGRCPAHSPGHYEEYPEHDGESANSGRHGRQPACAAIPPIRRCAAGRFQGQWFVGRCEGKGRGRRRLCRGQFVRGGLVAGPLGLGWQRRAFGGVCRRPHLTGRTVGGFRGPSRRRGADRGRSGWNQRWRQELGFHARFLLE